jgi:hypothetical protein
MDDQEKPWQIVPTKGWGPVELGMTRAQAQRALKEAGAELEEDEEDDPTYLGVEKPWGDLYFEGAQCELSEIVVLDDEFAIGEQTFCEPRLDEVLTAIGARSFNDTKWTHPTLKSPLPPEADKEFLRLGTLWLVSHGIGLELYRGAVDAVKIHRAHDAPTESLGPLTPQQLELATTPDIFEEEVFKPKPDSPAYIWASRAALLALVVALGFQAYRGYLAETYWNGAQEIKGLVVKTLPEGETFPDVYVVEYAPTKDQAYQVDIRTQFAGGLFKTGENIDLIYLPEAPTQATTLSEARSSGFPDFIPAMLGMGAVYMLVLAVCSATLR